MGVASSLMYPPGLFADTDELIALSAAAAEFDGMYISHMRDEGAHMIEAVEELITIAREAGIRAEIYHIKSSGEPNWPLFDEAVRMIEDARDEGLAGRTEAVHGPLCSRTGAGDRYRTGWSAAMRSARTSRATATSRALA